MSPSTLTPAEFVQRWAGRELTERAAAQSHFTDLCRMLGVAAPTDNREHDPNYGFEARTDISASGVYATRTGDDGLPYYQITTGSGAGFADVWKRDHFAWEYKRAGKHATLDAALVQLRIYAASLGNPRLLIVSDIDRCEIHTNFNDYPTTRLEFHITDLVKPSDAWKKANPRISPIEVLRKVFDDVNWFKPEKTRQAITADLAKQIGGLAIALRDGGNEPHAVAHFVMQIVFCFFAEDIGLLPRKLFTSLIEKSHDSGNAADFPRKARSLFKAMEAGGHFGADTIEWFNGGLFKDVDRDPLINIDMPRLGTLLIAAKSDWNAVDPSIFGTLFERSLDPGKRSQIGAHYTSREDIMLIVEPVVMQPLRRKWVNVQKDVAEWLEQRRELGQSQVERASVPAGKIVEQAGTPAPFSKQGVSQRQRALSKKIETAITAFADELGSIKILDPACGSGNFLYVTIQQLLDLENEVRGFATRKEISVTFTPRVQPRQLMGIDINDYACELARVSIWIGYLQWLHANSDTTQRRPILDPLDTIENRDAILDLSDPEKPKPAEWPIADFVIGNPPFLGTKMLRGGLGDQYVEELFEVYENRIPGFSDLCCYWFELGRIQIVRRSQTRVGLLATQAIRNGAARRVLERIKESGDIFMAWSDRPWMLDGAAVQVSMVGFDSGIEGSRVLDGHPCDEISTSLTSGVDLAHASRISENKNVAFVGDVKGGPFDIDWAEARKILVQPSPNGISAAQVVRPYTNGLDITRRDRSVWIIDFGVELRESDAAGFGASFDHVAQHVKPMREEGRPTRSEWWLHMRPCPSMRDGVEDLPRYLATPTLTKHRLFTWMSGRALPDHQLIVFARTDDYFFGVLHSAVHCRWSLDMGTQLENRPRYTPTTCFETFPLPWLPGKEPVKDANYKAIAAAAKELNELREAWLNPPEWIKPIEDAVDRFEDFSDVPKEAQPLLRHSAIMGRAAKDARLKKRTLTNLYNERPGWLKLAHRTLDEAVLRAYKTVDSKGDWDEAWAAAYEPFGAGEIVIATKGPRKNKDSPETVAAKQAAIAMRKDVDEKILANLLRLNQQRAATGSQA